MSKSLQAYVSLFVFSRPTYNCTLAL